MLCGVTPAGRAWRMARRTSPRPSSGAVLYRGSHAITRTYSVLGTEHSSYRVHDSARREGLVYSYLVERSTLYSYSKVAASARMRWWL